MLERHGVLGETAVLVSADHGEAFGELGQHMEHGAATPATNRVPLIVRWPGLTDEVAGHVCDKLLPNLDLAPTVADAFGLNIPSGWAGWGFLPLLKGDTLAQPRDQPVFPHGLHTRQRAVFAGRYLFIRIYQPSFYLNPPRMLFDLRADPHLTRDLASEEGRETARLETPGSVRTLPRPARAIPCAMCRTRCRPLSVRPKNTSFGYETRGVAIGSCLPQLLAIYATYVFSVHPPVNRRAYRMEQSVVRE